MTVKSCVKHKNIDIRRFYATDYILIFIFNPINYVYNLPIS